MTYNDEDVVMTLVIMLKVSVMRNVMILNSVSDKYGDDANDE